MTGIYKIETPHSFVYIGQSTNIHNRWLSHASPSKRHGSIGVLIMAYGASNCNFSVVHELPEDVSQDVLNNYERFYIQQYKGAGLMVCNKTKGGFCWPKNPMSEVTKQRIRNAKKGKPFVGQHRINVITSVIARNIARTLTPEQKQLRKKKRWKEKEMPGTTMNFGFGNGRSKIILHTEYGIFVTSREAEKMVNKSEQWMGQVLGNKRNFINKTPFIYT